MIRHQAIRDHCCAVLMMVSLHQLQKIMIIPIVEENLPLPRPAIIDMIILPLRKSITAIWHGYLLKRPAGSSHETPSFVQTCGTFCKIFATVHGWLDKPQDDFFMILFPLVIKLNACLCILEWCSNLVSRFFVWVFTPIIETFKIFFCEFVFGVNF